MEHLPPGARGAEGSDGSREDPSERYGTPVRRAEDPNHRDGRGSAEGGLSFASTRGRRDGVWRQITGGLRGDRETHMTDNGKRMRLLRGKIGACTCVLGRGAGGIRNNLFKRQTRFHCFPCLIISKCHSTAFRIKPKLLTVAQHQRYRIWARVRRNLTPAGCPVRQPQDPHGPLGPCNAPASLLPQGLCISCALPGALCPHATGLFLSVRSRSGLRVSVTSSDMITSYATLRPKMLLTTSSCF